MRGPFPWPRAVTVAVSVSGTVAVSETVAVSSFFVSGLLVRLRRPSVARAARSLGWLIGGLRPRCSGAGGLLPIWKSRSSSPLPWVARHGHCAEATLCREVLPAQCHARHAPLGAFLAFFHHDAPGWRRRQVIDHAVAATVAATDLVGIGNGIGYGHGNGNGYGHGYGTERARMLPP